jgi:hypothetical protein
MKTKEQQAVIQHYRGTPEYIHFLRYFLDKNNIKRSIDDCMRDNEFLDDVDDFILTVGLALTHNPVSKGNN